MLTWIIGNDVTSISGKGSFIIRCEEYVYILNPETQVMEGQLTTVKHTQKIRYTVGEGYDDVWDEPYPIQNYVDLILDMKNHFRVANGPIPESSLSPGLEGEMRWDEDFLYICMFPNMWKRIYMEEWEAAPPT